MMPAGMALCLLGAILTGRVNAPPVDNQPRTFCNPMNLPYSFRPEGPSRREAADPTMIVYKGEYWLFASKCEGYWHSRDFVHWNLVVPTGLPIDNYAPTVVAIKGKLYWTAAAAPIYVTDDPAKGVWRKVSDMNSSGDPDLFLDDDGRVYLYSGCSKGGPIVGQELDPNHHFAPITRLKALIKGDVIHRGWEIRADGNAKPPYKPGECYIEGAWMNKRGGKYYLQYSAPGTEYKTYGDGVFVSDHPLGPFTYAPYSPFSLKPGGFADGAGHGSTFRDLAGRYWHIATSTISVREIFERRIGVYPTGFTPDGQLTTNTYLGDYPQYLPGVVHDWSRGNSPGWMLLSYKKPATASSTLNGHPVDYAFNEDLRTWWSAKTGDPREWLRVDLGKRCRVNAIQINVADEGSTQFNRMQDGYGYKLDLSDDGRRWATVIDRRTDRRDAPHDYVELPVERLARYARITNTHSPGGAKFSISGLRLFGNGLGHAPEKVGGLVVRRNPRDDRQADLSWKPVKGADGYIVRYGIGKDRLFASYQVYDGSSLHIHTLNTGVPYYFAVDSFNDSGVNRGTHTVASLAARIPTSNTAKFGIQPISKWNMAPTGTSSPAVNDLLTADGEQNLWTANGLGGIFPTVADAPPASMLAKGNAVGSVSFNAGAFLGTDGALFYPQDIYDDRFSFTDSFSIEMFFKSSGDKSGAGVMQLLRQGEMAFRYGITLNESAPGGIRFSIDDGDGHTPAVNLTRRNYADGTWHYLLATYNATTSTLSISVANQGGKTDTVHVPTGTFSGLPVRNDGNLFIGRHTYKRDGTPRTFQGLINLVQITPGIGLKTSHIGTLP